MNNTNCSIKPIVFIFIGGYLPAKKQGGPVTSIRNFVEHFSSKYEIRIVCSNHEMGSKECFKNICDGWNQRDLEYVYYLSVKNFTVRKFTKLMTPFSNRIHVAYLSGIYITKLNLPAINACRKLHVPVVLAPRGDIMRNAIRMNGFISAMKKYCYLAFSKYSGIYSNMIIQATSDEEKIGAKKYLGINEEDIFLIPNLPMAPSYKTEITKEKDKIRLIFISRIMVKKNLKHAIQIIADIPDFIDVELDIFGPIEEDSYWNECQTLIHQIKARSKRINYCGSLAPEDAKSIYKNYDAFLFPTLSENYGHVIAEALLNDCMAIISRGTTPWDGYEGNGVYLGNLDSTDEFVKKIVSIAKMSSAEYEIALRSNRIYISSALKIDSVKNEYEKMFEIARYKMAK